MFIVNTLKSGTYIVRLVYVIYFMIAGLLCVAYYIFIHEVLSISARKGQLLKNSLLIIGIQMLVICLIHLGLLLYGYFPKDSFGIFLVVVEGLVGATMLFFAFRKKKLST
jgi:Na+/H+ antiporter NhaD/arsenite permease-like protein